MSALPLITVLKDGEKISEHQVERDVSIGRDEGCVIRLEDRAISRKHALLRVVTEGLQIEKKSQFGGLTINGEEKTSALIKTGDLIALGPYLIKVQFQDAEKAASTQSSASSESSDTNREVGLSSQSSLGVDLTPNSIENAGASEPIQSDPVDPNATSPITTDSASIDPNAPLTADSVSADAQPAVDHAAAPYLVAAQEPTPSSDNPFDENADGKTRVLSQSSGIVGRLVFEDGMGGQREFIVDKDEVSIGRSKECDLTIDDKRSSRKHAIIQRFGIKFVLKDLQSANGTFINDIQVQEQELESGNTIRVGDHQFIFEAMSSEYSGQAPEQTFDDSSDSIDNYEGGIAMPQSSSIPLLGQSATEQTQSIVGISKSSSESKKGSLIDQFKSLPPKKRMIYGLVLVFFVYFLMEEDPEPTKKRVPASKQGVGQKATPTFDKLTQKEKSFVTTQYQLAFDLYTSKQYDKSIYEVSKIFDLIPDYKDSRDILRYAEEGKRRLAAIEAENKKREEESRIRQRVAELEEEVSKLLLNKKFDQAAELFPQISELDPENTNVEKWQGQVNDYITKKRKDEELKVLTERLTEQAKGIREDAQELLEKKEFRKGINKIADALKLAPVTDQMKEALKSDYDSAIAELGETMNPLLDEAKAREEEKDFTGAYKIYEQAMLLDPDDVKPKEGIERIRDTLNLKAKGLYTEGLLFESYSDFENAKLKFAEAKETAPQDDEYYAKASRKLKKFEILYLALPQNPRQPSSAGPPELKPEDLAPDSQPGVPKEKQLGAKTNAGTGGYEEPPPPSESESDAPAPMPDFQQLIRDAAAAKTGAGSGGAVGGESP